VNAYGLSQIVLNSRGARKYHGPVFANIMRAMLNHGSTYIPALSHDWLTPMYDILMRWTMPESRFKRQLVVDANIQSHARVLDLGCGTATLTLLIKSIHPNATVIGIDGDEKILRIGRKKAGKAGIDVTLTQALAFALPYADASFDRVLSSLMFHHLTRENKVRSLKEVYRVLRKGGEIHIADFGKPQNLLMRLASYPWQMFDGSTTTKDILAGALPDLMTDSGFTDVREPERYMTLFGTLRLYSGRKDSVQS
jgi:SAM-dependent methyltransferase